MTALDFFAAQLLGNVDRKTMSVCIAQDNAACRCQEDSHTYQAAIASAAATSMLQSDLGSGSKTLRESRWCSCSVADNTTTDLHNANHRSNREASPPRIPERQSSMIYEDH